MVFYSYQWEENYTIPVDHHYDHVLSFRYRCCWQRWWWRPFYWEIRQDASPGWTVLFSKIIFTLSPIPVLTAFLLDVCSMLQHVWLLTEPHVRSPGFWDLVFNIKRIETSTIRSKISVNSAWLWRNQTCVCSWTKKEIFLFILHLPKCIRCWRRTITLTYSSVNLSDGIQKIVYPLVTRVTKRQKIIKKKNNVINAQYTRKSYDLCKQEIIVRFQWIVFVWWNVYTVFADRVRVHRNENWSYSADRLWVAYQNTATYLISQPNDNSGYTACVDKLLRLCQNSPQGRIGSFRYRANLGRTSSI